MTKLNKIVIICTSLLFLFCGCSAKIDVNEELEQTIVDAEQKNVNKSENNIVETDEDNVEIAKLAEVNTQAQVVEYDGEIHFANICISDGENLILYQSSEYGEAGFYKMKVGQSEVERIELDIPEYLDVTKMTTDMYGNIYLLLTGNTEFLSEENTAKHEIWILNDKFEVSSILDISDSTEGEKLMPYQFLVDQNGSYFIQWGYGSFKGIFLDKQGKLIAKINNTVLEIDELQTAGLGQDGSVYMCYRKDEHIYISRLNMESGKLENQEQNTLFDQDELVLSIGAGTDTQLLIYSTNSGIWAYDQEENYLENRVAMNESDTPFDTYILIRKFLPDGRLLLIENITNTNGELGKRILKYIPAGK